MTEISGETMSEQGVELTHQELGVLAQLLNLPTAAGIETNPIDDLPEAAREPVVESVIASLEARRIVTRTDDGIDVAEPVQIIMVAASVPGLVGIISRQAGEVVDTTFLSLTPEIGVQVESVAHSVYRLTPFAAEDLLARILRLSDLHPVAPPGEYDALEIEAEQLELCAQNILDDDDEGALAALGGPSSTSKAFLQALKAKRSSSQVTILHKPEGDRVEGGTVAWIDAGFRGIWITEAVEEDGEATGIIQITCTDAKDIAAELFTYLPEVFSTDEPLANG